MLDSSCIGCFCSRNNLVSWIWTNTHDKGPVHMIIVGRCTLVSVIFAGEVKIAGSVILTLLDHVCWNALWPGLFKSVKCASMSWLALANVAKRLILGGMCALNLDKACSGEPYSAYSFSGKSKYTDEDVLYCSECTLNWAKLSTSTLDCSLTMNSFSDLQCVWAETCGKWANIWWKHLWGRACRLHLV